MFTNESFYIFQYQLINDKRGTSIILDFRSKSNSRKLWVDRAINSNQKIGQITWIIHTRVQRFYTKIRKNKKKQLKSCREADYYLLFGMWSSITSLIVLIFFELYNLINWDCLEFVIDSLSTRIKR